MHGSYEPTAAHRFSIYFCQNVFIAINIQRNMQIYPFDNDFLRSSLIRYNKVMNFRIVLCYIINSHLMLPDMNGNDEFIVMMSL
jgi:hypothetical protein